MWHLAEKPCELPKATVPEFIDIKAVAEYFRAAFEDLKEDHFLPKAIWRDIFALTGSMRTFYTSRSVSEAWRSTASINSPTKFVVEGEPRVVRVATSAWIEIPFTFETNGTPATNCYGFISVAPDTDGKWKIWILRTILEGLKSQPDVDFLEPAEAVSETSGPNGHASTNGSLNGDVLNETRDHQQTNGEGSTSNGKDDYFDTVIIGGGQAGLSVGGRLKALGVSYVILEKHEQVGDNWKTRYDSTKLHTVREFAHLPFEQTFPPSYQEWLTKDDLADAYQRWARKFDINIWLSTTLIGGSWNSEDNTWTLRILRNGQESTLRSSFVVLAVGGNSQFPLMPSYPNREAFRGTVIHSAEYKNALGWKGKDGVVVGTANTAHDVADDMVEAGLASVTMIQRTKTYVVPREHYRESHDKVYNGQIPIPAADRMFFTGPAVLGRIMAALMLHGKAAKEPERFDALEKAGFLLDRDGDMSWYLLERFGGHYMDVGTSAKIAKGLIKMKSDSLPVRYTEDGLEFADGTRIRTDVIVFCTGFLGNLRLVVQDLFGPEVASQVDDFWGTDEEGELKGAFKYSGHPGFFYHGGAVGQARYMSRFIALQIKAKMLGTPLPIYTATPPRLTFPELKQNGGKV